ncbi:MAG: tol-pal system protein YbgF [Desulfobacteraceae bacterium]|nr:tol-pal system protein YbgF [Desulfobacteraceae bacterium]
MGISISIKHFGIKLGILIGSILFFTSCVTQKEFLYLNDQVVALNKRVNSLQETTENKLDSKLISIREQQATTDIEIDKIREEMRNVSGRLDENNHLVRHAIERDTIAQDDMRASVTDLKDRISELETKVNRINAYLGLEIDARQEGQDLKKTPMVAQVPVPQAEAAKKPVPDIKQPEVSPEKRLYDLTLRLYREEKYEEAIAGFKNFIKKFPKSELADNAQYWVGESYMGLKQYEQAILAFQSVIKKYPKGNKVPNAILRQALAFYEIKDKTSARLLLKKLIKKYPKSSEAKIAKAKLRTMK